MRNIVFSSQWGIQFTVSIMTVLSLFSGNDSATAQDILQVSDFSQHQGTAKDLEIVPKLIPENTSTISNKMEAIAQNTPSPETEKEEEADIELTVVGEILDQPVFTPFRREGKVRDATRPV